MTKNTPLAPSSIPQEHHRGKKEALNALVIREIVSQARHSHWHGLNVYLFGTPGEVPSLPLSRSFILIQTLGNSEKPRTSKLGPRRKRSLTDDDSGVFTR